MKNTKKNNKEKKNNKDHGYKKYRDEAWIILEDCVYVGEKSNFLNYGQTGQYNRKDSTFYPHGEDVSYYIKAENLYFGAPVFDLVGLILNHRRRKREEKGKK